MKKKLFVKKSEAQIPLEGDKAEDTSSAAPDSGDTKAVEPSPVNEEGSAQEPDPETSTNSVEETGEGNQAPAEDLGAQEPDGKEDEADIAADSQSPAVEKSDTDETKIESDVVEKPATGITPQIESKKETTIVMDNSEATVVKIYRTQELTAAVLAEIEEGKYAVPAKATAGSAGYDVAARLNGTKFGGRIVIRNGETALIPTGFTFDIPDGYEFQVRPRSGLSLKGIRVGNAPGTIDCDFKDEVKIILHNVSGSDFTVNDGDRIAQLIFDKVEPSVLEIGNLADRDSSGDREGGFGSTGV